MSALIRSGILLLLALTGLTPVGASTVSGADAARPPALPRVRVSADNKTFVLGETGKRFVPWGFNYLGKFDHLAEEDWHTEAGWKRLETDFRSMRQLGANVVRWHLQFETFMTGPDRPNAAQLARLKKLLALARANELYLDLTGLNCYRLKRIPPWFDRLSEADRWKAQARFWEAVAETCAGDTVVFCYDLMNEPVIGEAKKGEHPWVGGELGGFHFVQRISNQPAGRDGKDIAEAWVKSQVEAIRRHDKATLVTVGVIPWSMVWPNAKPIFYAPRVARHLDFVSAHFYPDAGKVEKALAALTAYEIGKPLVVEETFPLACSIQDLDRFIDGAGGRVQGWISHYFGYTPAEHRAGAKPNGKAVAEFLDYWQKKGAKITSPAAGAGK